MIISGSLFNADSESGHHLSQSGHVFEIFMLKVEKNRQFWEIDPPGKISENLNKIAKMTASVSRIQKYIICRGYLYPFERFISRENLPAWDCSGKMCNFSSEINFPNG